MPSRSTPSSRRPGSASESASAAEAAGATPAAQAADPEAKLDQGIALLSQGRVQDAIAALEAAIAAAPGRPEPHFALGNALRELGRHEAAVASFDRAIALAPDLAEAHCNRAIALRYLGRPAEALTGFARALQADAALTQALLGHANALRDLGRPEQARLDLERALQLRPDYAFAHLAMGNVLQDLGRHEQAVRSYRRALEIRPELAQAHGNLGNALLELGQGEAAVSSLAHAVALDPGNASLYGNLGAALCDLGRPAEAVPCLERALELDAGFAPAHANLGNALRELGRPEQALSCYERALALRPDFAQALANRGNALRDLGRQDEAARSFAAALEADPEFAPAKWKLALGAVALVPQSAQEQEAGRAAFARGLQELRGWFEDGRLEQGVRAVGTLQPFYLAYEERDNVALLRQYGALCTRLMGAWQEKHAPRAAAAPRAGRPLRLAIVSAQLRRHSVWDAIVKGWVGQLDPGRVELQLMHLGGGHDDQTDWARSRSRRYEQGPHRLEHWVRLIGQSGAQVLLYPEIGMDPMTLQLASLRLAPVQAAAWGHPETTGLPTIDYYLSGADFEPAGAQDAYTEKLVCLPHLGCHYVPPELAPEPFDLAAAGLAGRAPLLVCAGVPFKYAPQDDAALVQIAQRLGRCCFVFFAYRQPGWSQRLHGRLERAFSGAGLAWKDYAVVLPWLEPAQFHSLLTQAHALLDTVGFSGFNTAMQALAAGLPVVTREGRFLRGRLASGILRRLDMGDLVAPDLERYVALAVRLARDAGFAAGVRERIGRSLAGCYGDLAPIRALEDFLAGVAPA